MGLVRDHRQLRVYSLGFEAAMRIFELSRSWPKEERYALTDQVRRSSRAVCSNIAEAWFKRRYLPNFVNKLSDATAEAAETITWLDFALACNYIDHHTHQAFQTEYRQILGGLTKMMAEPDTWCAPSALREEAALYNLDQQSSEDGSL